jgi:hypothetical protein
MHCPTSTLRHALTQRCAAAPRLTPAAALPVLPAAAAPLLLALRGLAQGYRRHRRWQ